MTLLSGIGAACAMLMVSCAASVALADRARSLPNVPRGDDIEVVVPQIVIYPGSKIEEGLLTTKRLRANSLLREAVFTSRSQVAGFIARRTLVPGQPIAKDSVRAAYVVSQGQPVAIQFQSGAITIVLTGTAVQSGSVGDVIGVRNSDTGRVVRARIAEDRTLSVVAP